MSDTTTVRVERTTRDQLKRLSAERGQSVDALIQLGLRLLEREAWMRRAELEVQAAAADPEDRAEVRRILDELGE